MIELLDDDGGNGKTKTVQRDKAKMLKPLNIINKDPEPESKMITTDKGVFVETNYIKNEGLADMVNYRGGARSDSDVKIQNDIDQLLSQPVLIQKGGKVKNFGESKTTTASSNDEEVRQKLDKILLSDFTNSIKNGQDASLTKVPSKNQIEGNDDKKTPSSNNIDEIKEEKKEAEPEIKLEDLKKLGDLGAGSQGHVSKMMDKTTGNIIALKVIKLNSDQSFLKSLKIELQTLQSCRSEFIVHCQGVFLDQDTISIALEYMDKGSLAGLLKKMGKLSETILGMITFQVSS